MKLFVFFLLQLALHTNAAPLAPTPLTGMPYIQNYAALDSENILFMAEENFYRFNTVTGRFQVQQAPLVELKQLGCLRSINFENAVQSGDKFYFSGERSICEYDLKTQQVKEIKTPYSVRDFMAVFPDGSLAIIENDYPGDIYRLMPSTGNASLVLRTEMDILRKARIKVNGNKLYIADNNTLAVVDLFAAQPQIIKFDVVPSSSLTAIEVIGNDVLLIADDGLTLYSTKSNSILKKIANNEMRDGVSKKLKDGRIIYGGGCIFGVAPCRPRSAAYIYEPLKKSFEKIKGFADPNLWDQVVPLDSGEALILTRKDFSQQTVEIFAPKM